MKDTEELKNKLDYMEKENMILKKYISELADKIDKLSAEIRRNWGGKGYEND